MTAEPIRTPLQRRVDAITADTQRAAALARQASNSVMGFDREQYKRELRDMLLMAVGSWRRPCFVCTSTSFCEHRESELVERWEKGYLK